MAHSGQKRLSGEPYFTHTAATALYLAQTGADANTIIAGLLHDTVEDTDVTSEDIELSFGKEVSFLVDGVTKIGTYAYHGPHSAQENLQKLTQAAMQDPRVIIIKLYDRLHNMQTNFYHTKERAHRKAEETMNTYVPIAKRLNMGRVQKSLEDLAFKYIDNISYEVTKRLFRKERRVHYPKMEEVVLVLTELLQERHIPVSAIEIREKGLWSLHQKILRKDGDLTQVHDILALRIVVPDKDMCYKTLGAVHSIYKPIPGEFKDYIGFPKPNGYQSIHTTLITPQAGVIEVQIRSQGMHLAAQFGSMTTATTQ